MRFFQKIIYYSCYLLYKVTMKLRHPEIKALWYRNSFCFDYWVFLKSDIDITIVFEKADKKIMKAVSDTHSVFRRFFPIIGELVIFSEDHHETLLSCVNKYELKRDVFLSKKYGAAAANDVYEKIIFLHKFIGANWSKKNISNDRPEKILFINKHLQLEKNKDLLDLIDVMAELLEVDRDQFKKDYTAEMDNREKNLIHFNFPISNLIYVLFYNQLCYLHSLEPLTEQEKSILKKNLSWELWGAFSYQTSILPEDFKKHYTRLTNGLSQISDHQFAKEFENYSSRLELI